MEAVADPESFRRSLCASLGYMNHPEPFLLLLLLVVHSKNWHYLQLFSFRFWLRAFVIKMFKHNNECAYVLSLSCGFHLKNNRNVATHMSWWSLVAHVNHPVADVQYDEGGWKYPTRPLVSDGCAISSSNEGLRLMWLLLLLMLSRSTGCLMQAGRSWSSGSLFAVKRVMCERCVPAIGSLSKGYSERGSLTFADLWIGIAVVATDWWVLELWIMCRLHSSSEVMRMLTRAYSMSDANTNSVQLDMKMSIALM